MINYLAPAAKNAFNTLSDLIFVPVVYNLWYEKDIFWHPDLVSAGFLSACLVSFCAKMIVEKYKESNAHLNTEMQDKIINIIESSFVGIKHISHLTLEFIIADIILNMRKNHPYEWYHIIHPVISSLIVGYGSYRGLQHYGLLAEKSLAHQELAIPQEIIQIEEKNNVRVKS